MQLDAQGHHREEQDQLVVRVRVLMLRLHLDQDLL